MGDWGKLKSNLKSASLPFGWKRLNNSRKYFGTSLTEMDHF